MTMKKYLQRFFDWYEKYTEHNVLIATALFFTQAAHLTWLALFVIAGRLTGQPLWTPSDAGETLLVVFDYFEIPALIASTILYASLIRKGEQVRKAWLYIIFINIQYLHIFWITDEFVVDAFSGEGDRATILPPMVAWVAIMIDYLEVPVMIDTARRSIKIINKRLTSR